MTPDRQNYVGVYSFEDAGNSDGGKRKKKINFEDNIMWIISALIRKTSIRITGRTLELFLEDTEFGK